MIDQARHARVGQNRSGAHDKNGASRLGAHDRSILSRQIFLCRNKLHTIVKKKKTLGLGHHKGTLLAV